MKCLLIICSLYFSCVVYAQNDTLQATVTSLKNKIAQAEGREKLDALDRLSNTIKYQKEFAYDSIVRETIAYAQELHDTHLESYHTVDLIFYLTNRVGKPEEGVQLFDDFLVKKNDIKDPAINARLHLNGADSYYFAGETENAIPLYKIAGEYASTAKDSLLLGNSKNYLSDAFAAAGQFAEATNVLAEAETIFEQTKDTIHILTSRNSKANLFSRIGFFEEASQQRKEVISLAEKINDYRMLQSVYFNASIDNNKTNDLKARIYNLKKALFYVKKAKLKSYEPKILSGLLASYSLTDSIQNAKKIIGIIQENPEGYTQGLDRAYYTKAMAYYKYAQKDYKAAIDYAEDLFKIKNNTFFENTTTTHEFLAKAYEALGNDRKAYEHHKKYAKLRDSILAIQNVRAFTYYQTLYETEKREAEIQSQQTQISILNADNKIKNQWFLFGGVGILSLFIILWLIRSQKYVKKKQVLKAIFTQELINGQETERVRLARELHDSVGQKLMLLSQKAKIIGDSDMNTLTGNTLQELRNVLKGLHPSTLEKLGFSVAIQSLINEVDTKTCIFFTSEIEKVDPYISKDVTLHLYRIIQELLSNIVKHANTKSVNISITQKDQAIVTVIKDNGKGFNFTEKYKSAESLGMKILLERVKIINSKIEIDSVLGKGTTVVIYIPI